MTVLLVIAAALVLLMLLSALVLIPYLAMPTGRVLGWGFQVK